MKKDGGTESEKFNIYPEATGENKGHWTLALKNSDGTYYEDGTYEFTFTAESQGLTTTKQCTIVLDSTQPTISKPSLTQNKNGTVVTVSGSADGGLSGLDTANGAEFKYCFVEKGTEPRNDDWETKTNISLYSWKFDIDSSNLPETEHTLFVRIKDTAGNMTEESANIVIDKTNPALTVNGAENGKWVSNQIQAITGTASDPHFDKLTVKVGDGDAVEIPVNATTHEWSWQPAADTADGTYSVEFTATDKYLDDSSDKSKSTLVTTSFTLDRGTSEVNIAQLSQNDRGTKVTVSGTSDDTLSGFAEFKYCFVEKGTEPGDDDWHILTSISFYSWKFDIDTSNLPETEHTLYVCVTNVAGSTTQVTRNIVIDKTNPALTVNGAENGKWVSNQIQAITGTASDPHFDKLTVKVGDGDAVEIPVNATTHEWSWQPAADTADGTYSVEFTATDKYLDDGSEKAKSTAITTNFTLDRVRPEIEVQNIENGGVYRKGKDVSSPLEVRSMTTDELSGVQSIEYKVNDQLTYTPLENISSNWTVNLKNLPESENTIYIRATDKAGNTKELAPITFKTDYYAPTAIFGEISGGQNNQDDWTNENNDRIETKENIVLTGKLLDAANTDTVTYTFSYSRDDGGTDEISVDSATFNNAAFASKGFTWDNDPESDTYGKWTYNLPTSKGEGTYVFTLSASDIAGNTTKRTRTVLVDTKAPDLTVTSPLEDEQITAAYRIAGTIRDDGSKFGNDESGIFYSFDRGENKTWTRLARTMICGRTRQCSMLH